MSDQLRLARAKILLLLAGRSLFPVFCKWTHIRGLPDETTPEAGSHLWSIALRDLMRERLVERGKRPPGGHGRISRHARHPRRWYYRATGAGWAAQHNMVLVDVQPKFRSDSIETI